MSTETKTETEHLEEHHHELPLVPAFVSLLIMTVLELIIAELEGSFVTPLLLLLTVTKAMVVGAVFMEIAYQKDTKNIILYVFVVPLIAVLFLIFTIIADWR